jgi:Fe-S-cluster containining protein
MVKFENLYGPADIENQVKRSLKDLLEQIHSPVSLAELWIGFHDNKIFRDVLKNWPDWATSYRQRQWEALCREMEKAAYGTRPYCLHCGDCCRRGSPTLMNEDLPSLRKGILRRMDLITLREGELGFDNNTRELLLLEEERIKIKEKPGTRECLFWDSATKNCTIYEDRPIQCRVMECWNPDYFSRLKSQYYLSRKELLNPDDPLVPVIETHNNRCSLSLLQKALTRAKRGFADAQDEALDILFFDDHLRSHLQEAQGIAREHQLFLFGRPISDLIASFGFSIKENPNGRLILAFNPESNRKP